jgi:hypothetical protein
MPEVLRVQRPFWIHQLVEYLIGMMLIGFAFRSLEPAVPAVMGIVIILNAAVAIGGAGAFRLIPRKLHKKLDVVVMLLLLAAAFQPWISVDNTSRLLLGALSFVLWFIWFHTDFTTRAERKADTPRATSEEIGRTAGRMIGNGVNSVRATWKAMTADDRRDDESTGEKPS